MNELWYTGWVILATLFLRELPGAWNKIAGDPDKRMKNARQLAASKVKGEVANVAALERRTIAMEERLDEALAAKEELREQNAVLREQNSALRDQTAELRGLADQLKAENTALREQGAALKHHNGELRGEVDTLTERVATLEAELNEVRRYCPACPVWKKSKKAKAASKKGKPR